MPNRRLAKFRLKLSLILLSVGAPAFILTIVFGQHLLVLLSLFVVILAVFLGGRRLTCPKCGKGHVAIAVDVTCCCHCGASYFPDDDAMKARRPPSAPANRHPAAQSEGSGEFRRDACRPSASPAADAALWR